VRQAKRECVDKPEKGAHVTVKYAPDDSSRAQVDGDYRVDKCFFTIVFFVVVGAYYLFKALIAAVDRWGRPPAAPNAVDRHSGRTSSNRAQDG